ncbi:MAG TPA: extracellular solute-binding protein, partial [Candidatus Paenibacillus intestinavium]|nr:extracellular solute-binding protein [Candidatus Paenibacillus intestinavium]
MSKSKKSASLLVTMILAISLIVTACGGNNNPAPSNTPGDKTDPTPTPAAETPKEEELKAVKLVVVYPGGPQKDEKLIEEELNKLLTEKINATIDLTPVDWGAWDDTINLMIASREEVDVLFTAQWNGHASNVGKGAFLELNDLIAQYGEGVTSSQDPAFLEGAKIKGKNYGVPTTKELAGAGGIVYNKEVADELGIDMTKVTTIQDLDAVYAVVKEK